MVKINTNINCNCSYCNNTFKVYVETSKKIDKMGMEFKKILFPDDFIIPCSICGKQNIVKIDEIVRDNYRNVNGRKPSENDRDWIKYGGEILKMSPDISDNQAKSLVSLASTLLSAYVAVIAFLNIQDKIIKNIYILALFLISVAAWLLSIFSNLRVSSPKDYEVSYSSVQGVKRWWLERAYTRYNRLKLGQLFFMAAMIISIMTLFSPYIYSYMYSPFEFEKYPQDVQFIISENQSDLFRIMPVELDHSGMETKPLKLLSRNSNTYLIQLNNGRIVEFNKELVKGIIQSNLSASGI
jgi:hypothetical protein